MDAPPPNPARRLHPAWAGSAIVVAATALCALLERHFELANLVLVYTAGVIVMALQHGRTATLVVSAASIALLDFIFVPPRWGFKPTDPQYYFTFAVMAALGWLVNALAQRVRNEAERSTARARRAQALAHQAARLAQARGVQEVVEAAQASVHDALSLQCTVVPGAVAPDAPGALQGSAGVVGRLEVDARAVALTADQRSLLDAMAHQVALALERADYQARSTEAQIESATERQRNTLLASISHDFRTPLTTIIGAATSLREQEGQLPPGARQALLSSVEHEARRLHALSSNLLELAGLQRGAVQPQLQWCPADELVAEACSALGDRLAHHHLQVEVDDQALVWCDPQLVQQLLVNLLDNVARHTPEGSAVRVAVTPSDGACEITVIDRHAAGPGAAGTSRAGGSHRGLGLSICSEIARLHGGVLHWVDDGGRSVTMHLPQPVVPRAALEDW